MDSRSEAREELNESRSIQAEREQGTHQDNHIHDVSSRRVNLYDNTTIGGHARVQLGDTHNHYHYAEQVQPDKYRLLLKSLSFARIDARLRNVAAALPKTCAWLIHHNQFTVWADLATTDQHHGFLWIKGKPGSGKSTVMKETLAWVEANWPSHIVLSYFFNARSPHQLEKSSLGLYRSLLHQLLQLASATQPLFIRRFQSKARKDVVEDWTTIEIQNFLIDLINTLHLPPVAIFIDALDEGSEDDIRQMISFLERLSQRAASHDRKLNICLSSRHYPHITVKKCLSIILEHEIGHSQDIELYIRQEFATDDNDHAHELRAQIRGRAAGVFLWVVLVIPTLKRASDKGQSPTAMLNKLQEVPEDLGDVFAQLFYNDPFDIDERTTLLQWVLFSMEPLTPAELFCAVRYAAQGVCINDKCLPSEETMVKWLLNCSRGLIEVTKERYPIVQFIHESVRDFLLSTDLYRQPPAAGQIPAPSVPDFQVDNCHMMLAEQSLFYMLEKCREFANEESIFSFRESIFVDYAARYWWRHAHTSRSTCSRRLLDLASEWLTDDPRILLNSLQLFNIDDGIEMDEPGLLEFSEEPSTVECLAPPLYYATLTGRAEIVSLILEHGEHDSVQGEQSDSRVGMIAPDLHFKSVQAIEVNAQVGTYGSALHAACIRNYIAIAQILIDAGADLDNREGLGGSALEAASSLGHTEVIELLIDAGCIFTAAECANVLNLATTGGHERTVSLLIRVGVDINVPKACFNKALYSAVRGDHENIVRLLLDAGADVNHDVIPSFGDYNKPYLLRVALKLDYFEMARLLIDAGATVDTLGDFVSDILYSQSPQEYNSEKKVVHLLLDAGADLNAPGGYFCSTLRKTSEYHYKQLVKILMDAGIHVNARFEDRG